MRLHVCNLIVSFREAGVRLCGEVALASEGMSERHVNHYSLKAETAGRQQSPDHCPRDNSLEEVT